MTTTNSAALTLDHVPLFSGCNRSELALVRRNTTPVRIPAGRTLVHEGGIGREFFAITAGTATVTIGSRRVATLGPGDFCGEISLLDGGVCTASVTTDTELLAHVSSEGEFRRLLDGAPHFASSLLVGLAHRVRTADGPGRLAVLASLSEQELRVATLVGGGLANKQVARELGLSAKTVEFHLSKIFRKLGVESRVALTRVLVGAPY